MPKRNGYSAGYKDGDALARYCENADAVYRRSVADIQRELREMYDAAQSQRGVKSRRLWNAYNERSDYLSGFQAGYAEGLMKKVSPCKE